MLDILIAEWNRTDMALPAVHCISDLFEQQAERTPDAIAVVYDGTSISYRSLDESANRLAHALRRRGVHAEVGVGVCLERSIDTIIAILAILKAGGAFIPFDPDYPVERLAFMLKDSRVPLLVTRSTVACLPDGAPARLLLDTDRDEISACPATPPKRDLALANVSCMFYTSGSTGTPKCAMLTHLNLVNYATFWQRTYLRKRPIKAHLQMTSFSFVLFVGDVVRALCTGASLVICPRSALLDPEDLYGLMIRENVNSAEFVTPVLNLLVDYLEYNGKSLEFLDLLAAGGDVWHAQDFVRAKRLCSPGAVLIDAYGMTETSMDSATYPDGDVPDDPASVVPAGRPTANTRLYILDERIRPVPIGTTGELFIGGYGVCRGYLRRPSLTARRFVPDPFGDPGSRIYRSGDVARQRPDGVVEIVGRADNQVKINGIRIEIGEIEAALRAHPMVNEGVVVAHGQAVDERHLAAYVTLTNTPPQDTEKALGLIRAQLGERLPAHMMPSVLLRLDSIPLNAHGKIDRHALTNDGDVRGPGTPDDDDSACRVLRNDEEQFSIWPAECAIPPGWTPIHKTGTQAECLAFIDDVWTDMLPRSLRGSQHTTS